MSTVHAKATVTTNSRHSGRKSRMKARPITCSGCGGSTTCGCLGEHRLHRLMVPALRQLLESGSDLTKRRAARETLAQLVEQDAQRIRETEALRAFCRQHVAPKPFSTNRDRYAVYHMFGEFTGIVGFNQGRSVERTAELFRRPVAYLKDLRARALHALHAPASSTASRRAA